MEYHAKEAEIAQALNIGDIWEPSPFPVELSEAEGRSRSNEPIFVPTPWIAKPPSLVQNVPDHPGEIRFANMMHRRGNGIVLLATLARTEAAEKHRNREHYVAATQLSRGQLVVLIHNSHWSPHDPHQPQNPAYIPPRQLYLWLYGSSALVLATFWAHVDEPDLLEFWTISVRKHDNSRTVWLAYNTLRENQRMIH